MNSIVDDYIQEYRPIWKRQINAIRAYNRLEDIPFRIKEHDKQRWVSDVMSNISSLSHSRCADEVQKQLERIQFKGIGGETICKTLNWILFKYDEIDKESNCSCFCCLHSSVKRYLAKNSISMDESLMLKIKQLLPKSRKLSTMEVVDMINHYPKELVMLLQ